MPQRIKAPSQKKQRLFLREWRQYRNLTLEQLADRMGTTKASVSRVERFKSGATGDFLAAAADALQCEVVDLLIRNPKDSESLWSLWDIAKPGERQMIIELAKTIIKQGRHRNWEQAT